MTQGKIEMDGQTIEVDTAGMEERVAKRVQEGMQKYFNELAEWRKTREAERGKGVVEAFIPDDKKARLVEEFQKGEHADPKIIREQWSIAIPALTKYEPAAHLRDYVFVTEAVKGKVGEDVTVPYVTDLDFAVVTKHTGTFTATTSLVSTLATTLKEAGAYYDAYYGDIEKIDQNLLDELNRTFAHAAVRAEDQELVKLLDALTTEHFEGAFGRDPSCGDTGLFLLDTWFKAEWVADCIGNMIRKGKEVHPGDCVLYLTPKAYGSLLKELAASQIIAYARGDIITKGIIEDYLGVRILVGGYVTKCRTSSYGKGGLGSTDTTYEVCYLMRSKRCLALAPKRDILIETDRIIDKRQLRIAGSHTFGVLVLDATEAIRIWTGNHAVA